MLRGAALETAVVLAERVRSEIEERVFSYNSVELKVTVSLGVSWWSGDDSCATPEALVEAADRNLYAAKEAGRNCVAHDPIEQ